MPLPLSFKGNKMIEKFIYYSFFGTIYVTVLLMPVSLIASLIYLFVGELECHG